jgi:hypothetical protein
MIAGRVALPLLAFLSAVSLVVAPLVTAQRVDSIGPDVRKYLRVITPRVILDHVTVIDGTGAEALPDRNVSIDGGTIAAISNGAEVPPAEGTTVLELRGYSVMPGIVGMHDHLWYLARPNLDVEHVEIVFKDGMGYDPRKLLDSVKGRYGEY